MVLGVSTSGKRVALRAGALVFCLWAAGCTSDGPVLGWPDRHAAATSATEIETRPAEEAMVVDNGEPLSAPAVERPNPVRVIGSGVFVGSAPAGELRSTLPDGDVTLNFANSDIREVASSVFEDILGANYFVDPNVAGKITLSTSSPIAREAVLPLIESVFRTAGAAVILDVDGVYRVLKEEDALALGAPVQLGPAPRLTSGYTIRVVPLHHASAGEISTILEPIAPSGSILHVDDARGVIVLAGGSDLLARLSQTIALFDVDWMAGMSFAIVPVDTPDVGSLVSDLDEVYGLSNGGSGSSTVHFMPLERLGSILVATRNPTDLAPAEAWIERMDRGETGSGRRLYVYNVQYGRADELSAVLSSVFGASGTGGAGGRAGRSIVAPTETAVGLGASGVDAFLDRPAADSVDMADPFATGPSPLASGAGRVEGLKIIPYVSTNSLAILGTPSEYALVEAALRRLDVPPLQVRIEAIVADVTLNDDLRLGVQWFFNDGDADVTLTESSSSIGQVTGTVPGFSATFTGMNASSAISALSSVTDVDILSRPMLVVSNNETASLQVGDQVPVVTRTSTSTVNPDSPIVSDVELRDTGVILNVTPRINANGMVTLEIEQEVSDVVATTTSGIDSPTIRQRRILTSVAVESGGSIALGGLIRGDQTMTRSGVPVAKDIPVLGALFRSQTAVTHRGELIVLLTPHVVRSQDDIAAITDELRRRALSMSEELSLN